MPRIKPIQRTVTIFFNPVSGKSDPDQRKRDLTGEFAQQGYDCSFLSTGMERSAKMLVQEALDSSPDLVAVSGGDGTVIEFLSELIAYNVPVAILPAGTGNLLALNLGIPTTLAKSVEVAVTGTPQEIDLARTDSGQYFAIMGGIGMDAQLIHDADRESKNRLGILAYFQSAWKNRTRRRMWLKIQLDDAPAVHRKVKTLLIANMSKITGGLAAVPTADPGSGHLEVGIVTVRTTWEWFRVIYHALRGKTEDDPRVEIYRVSQLKVRCDTPEPIQFDGEDGGFITELQVSVVPKAVQIITYLNRPEALEGR